MTALLRDRFFLVIVTLIVLQVIFVYTYDIAKLGRLLPHEEWGLTYMALQRVLFLGTIAIAAWRFGFKWGIATCFTTGLLIVTHVALEDRGTDAWLEVWIVITIAIVFSWLVSAYVEERRLLK